MELEFFWSIRTNQRTEKPHVRDPVGIVGFALCNLLCLLVITRIHIGHTNIRIQRPILAKGRVMHSVFLHYSVNYIMMLQTLCKALFLQEEAFPFLCQSVQASPTEALHDALDLPRACQCAPAVGARFTPHGAPAARLSRHS